MSVKNFSILTGKTIVNVRVRRHSKYDDEGYLDIYFADGTSVCLVATYTLHTGRSCGEYPTRLILREEGFEDCL